METVVRGSFFTELTSSIVGSAISFQTNYDCFIDGCTFLRCKSTANGNGGSVSLIGRIMKIARTMFEESEGYIGSAAYEAGSESNSLNKTVCLGCITRNRFSICQYNGYSTTTMCNVSLCSASVHGPAIQPFLGPKYHYSFISLSINKADYGHVPHCITIEEMPTERMCMVNQTIKISSFLYFPSIHLFCECIFLDEVTFGTFSTSPAEKVTFVDCFFRVLPTADSRVIVDSPHLIEGGDDQYRLFKEWCVYVPKSETFTASEETTVSSILAVCVLPVFVSN